MHALLRAPVAGFPNSPHRLCEGCFARRVEDALAEAHREVEEYAAGRTDFRPMFVRIDPYTQKIESRSNITTGQAHDPADPALGRLDPELRTMMDRLPPIGTQG